MVEEAAEIQVIGKAELIKVDKIPEAITKMLYKHRNIVAELELSLPSIKNEEVKKFLVKRLDDSKRTVKALEKGFVPIMVMYPLSLKPKTAQSKEALNELMKTLPTESKAALERAQKLGIFDQFAISGEPRGGDPVIIGVIRNKYFLISAWVNVDGGGAIGYVFKQRD